jgi:hypothetical protein
LFISIYEACKHRNDVAQTAAGLTQTVVAELVRLARQSVLQRETIIEVCATVLGRYDTAAQTVYSAYHR